MIQLEHSARSLGFVQTSNYKERSEVMKGLIALGALVAGCFVVWVIGKALAKITGLPIWGDDSCGPGRLPKP